MRTPEFALSGFQFPVPRILRISNPTDMFATVGLLSMVAFGAVLWTIALHRAINNITKDTTYILNLDALNIVRCHMTFLPETFTYN